MTEASREDRLKAALRFNALAAGSLAMVAALLLLAGQIPFPKTVAWPTLAASLIYFAYFTFFEHVYKSYHRPAGIALSQVGSLLITISIYYTGGIVSPLAFLYLAMLVSEAIYGLSNNFTVPVSAAGYLFVVGAQYSGFLPNPAVWSDVAYRSPAFVIVIAGLLVAYLFLTKSMSDQILKGLRARIEREAAERAAMSKKFSELDASAQIGALAHRIAHDMRAPLSSISGYVQMEMLREIPAERKAELEALSATVNSMTESLVCITRFGKVCDAPAERINAAEFFRQLLAIAAFSPLARGVKFVKKYSEDLDAWVSASRSDMQQAYFNIVKNALEATLNNSAGRTIEVSMRLTGGAQNEVEVVVADNGPGMPPELLKSLFRRNITTKQDGTGVGLVITRDILTRNDGYIEFRNRPEGGLEVITRLPAA